MIQTLTYIADVQPGERFVYFSNIPGSAPYGPYTFRSSTASGARLLVDVDEDNNRRHFLKDTTVELVLE